MSNDFWAYESQDTYRAKQAQDWAQKAQKDAFSYLAPSQTNLPQEALSSDSSSLFAPKPLITSQDKSGKSSGGFFKGVEDAVGSIGKPVYDYTLKPINRVLEAEHNAIARPLAKTLLSPFGDYNKLPGIVRLGAETLTDPLTYIGPGEVMGAFKAARLAPELKLGAPALQALFDSPGSRRLLTHIVTSGGLGLAAVGGNAAAQAVGIKGLPAMAVGVGASALAGKGLNSLTHPQEGTMVHVVLPKDTNIYHGTPYDFEGIPSSTPPSNITKSNPNHENMVFASTDKSKADNYAKSNGSEGRVVSMILPKGAKVWDPSVDRWPDIPDVDKWKDTFNSSLKTSGGAYLLDNMANTAVGENLPAGWYTEPLQEALKKEGYSAIKTGHEVAILDRSVLKSGSSNSPTASNIIKPSSADDLRQSMEQAWSKGRQAGHIDTSQEASAKRLASFGTEDDLMQRMYDQTEMLTLKKKIDTGDATDEEMSRAGELLAKADIYKQLDNQRQIGGGASGSTQAMQTLIDRMNSADPKVKQLINANSDIEVKANQQARQGWTVGARDALGNFMDKSTYGTNLSKYLKSHGFRLQDTDATGYINEAGRLAKLGDGYGSAQQVNAETILRRANEDGSLPTSYVKANGTVINDESLTAQAKLAQIRNPELSLLNPDGSLSLHTLVNNPDIFNLSPVQQATVQALTAPMQLHRGLENVFGVESQGPIAHVEPLDESGGVRNGVSAKQNFERPQGELAGAQGYLPYAEAQASRVQQGYHKIADSWLNATLDGMGKTASDLVPPELVDAINSTTNLRKQAHLLTKRIEDSLATYGTSKESPVNLPEDFLNSPHLDPQIKDIAWAVTQPGMRKPQIQPLLDRLNTMMEPIHALGDKQSAIMDEIRMGKGSQYRADYPTEFQGKYYPQDVGDQLNRYNQSVSPTGITKAVIDTNNLVRPIMATLDASFMGVQGLVAALSNPRAYMKALSTLTTNGYGDYEETLRSSGRLHAMLNDGVHWAGRNDMGEFLFPSSTSKIPGVGKLADMTDSAFTRFGNVLRSELYNSVNWDAMSAEKRLGLARTVNLMTGFSPNNPSNLESAMSFAPRFFRSQMGLIADAVTKRDMSTMGAARSLSTMLVSGTALTFAANKALGQETDFNPESPNFMRVRVGGQDVSVFGTWDTLARAVTKTYQTGNPLSGPEYLIRAKASPVMSKMYDVITGSTLQGTPIKWGSAGEILTSAAAEAQSVLPISATSIASNVAQDPSKLADPEFLGGQVLSFLGTKATPLSPAENMQIKRDTLAQQNFNKPWSQLEPYQQLQLHENNNVDLTPKSDLAKAFAFRRDISSSYQKEQDSIDKSLPVGKDWIDAYHNLQREKIGGFAQWNKEHPDAAAQISVGKPKNANDAALQKFYQLFDQADKESWSPDELTQNVSDFQSSISPEQQSYIDRNTGLHDTQRVKDYKADQKVLKPYWDISDNVYDRLKTRLPNSEGANSLQDYTTQLISKMQDAGVPDQVIAQRVKSNPVISEITRATSQLRERYRQTHPSADKLLSRWYGYSQVA